MPENNNNLKNKFQDLNKDFGLCTTYPRNFAVPATARDSVIAGSAKFRSRQRLPVLTYLHNNAGCIVRCAQPMAGANNRSEMVRLKKSESNFFVLILGRKIPRTLCRHKQE